ncbi:MAG: YbaK/EbsC family protein [Bacteroidota bacterium]
MPKKKIPANPAIRLLKDKNIPFELFQYDYEKKGGTAQTARELGVDEHSVIKTLVFENESGQLFILLMHGDCEVSAKNLARELGVKKIALADPRKAFNATGYKFGGTSPFGTRQKLDVCAEKTIFDLDRIYINAGAQGLIARIEPDALGRLIDAKAVSAAI